MIKYIISILALGFVLSACNNTADGLGKDIEKGGEKIQDAAEKNK